ncbi:MAG TPA: hypothetical protein VF630_14155 [Hymenobacter sp.]|jgi:hypothetical protein
MKKTLAALALLATVGPAAAQTGCPPPVVNVLRNNQVVPLTGAAFAPKVALRVTASPACGAKAAYRFRKAEVTLMRGKRPVFPTKLVRRPEVDLTDLMASAQAGDHIYFFNHYKDLATGAADGTLTLYPEPNMSRDQQKGIGPNMLTDDAKGIGFNWLLVQK